MNKKLHITIGSIPQMVTSESESKLVVENDLQMVKAALTKRRQREQEKQSAENESLKK
jgi:hypothetical protein